MKTNIHLFFFSHLSFFSFLSFLKDFQRILFFLVFGIFLFSHSSIFANSGVQLIFEECISEDSCQRVSGETEINTLFPVLQAGEKTILALSILNPEQKSLYSVESWLQFDPNIFEITELSDKNSDFPLSAPGEFEIDTSSEMIKIGRAIAGAPVIEQKSTIATFSLLAKKNTKGAKISFVDYRISDIGKTSVLTIENMVPQNILLEKPKDLLFSEIATHSAPSSYTNPVIAQPIQNGTSVYGVQNENVLQQDFLQSQYQNTVSQIPSFIDIPRPEGLRTRTYTDGNIDHIWKLGEDSRIIGYYLYYSTSSGEYMHRKDLGKTNVYRFPAEFFEKGKRIYFAVQAYDTNGKISDFSDETYVTVGTEGSESHPFFEQIFPDAQLDSEGKAYKNISGQAVSKKNEEQYSKNVSQNFPKQNIQSGNSYNFLFLLFGIGMFLIGIRKFQKK